MGCLNSRVGDDNDNTKKEQTELLLLQNATKGEDFSLNGEEFTARVVDVYDGDTIRVVFFRHGELQQHKVRMEGYDSPEMKPRLNIEHRQEEIKAARAAKAALIGMIHKSTQLVKIKCGKSDKYGRLLGTIYLDNGINVNAWMITHNYGKPYDGGKKTAFSPENKLDVCVYPADYDLRARENR